jgi:antitoxin VapB
MADSQSAAVRGRLVAQCLAKVRRVALIIFDDEDRGILFVNELDKPEKYLHPIAMATAKLFQHGGSQAVRLPKDFRFEGTEVEIEKRGDEVVLRPRPKPRLKTLVDVARFMHENFPEGRDFPDREQPLRPQIRDLDLDQD